MILVEFHFLEDIIIQRPPHGSPKKMILQKDSGIGIVAS